MSILDRGEQFPGATFIKTFYSLSILFAFMGPEKRIKFKFVVSALYTRYIFILTTC